MPETKTWGDRATLNDMDAKILAAGNHKQLVIYRDKYGYTVKGLLVSLTEVSTTGRVFICVDNFANRVFVQDVREIITLQETW